ncbi:hydroxyacylglutathione hydrolase [Alteromonas sp. ASW11-130]|uniref:hydroxyacylglutathione hydrolase n=1 Tax=Alteromonas sp. ASW11-130 TaxID=3015775 RepID=UPI00224208D6|nr:hydroxyacylglutathione hydrolase [Alteromonas sp. ASW11-130]MCW8092767.1 hydroxyacylglutathione hydrolase [Alteromonas sp. ASW11-130]
MSTTSLPSNVSVTPIPAFTDNYIWCLRNTTDAVVVDPGDAEPVLAYLKDHNLKLAGILITHHHHDHTGGITRLTSTRPDIPVIGPRGNHIRGITKSVTQGDAVHLPIINCDFTVLEIPGHTLDHIAFYGHDAIFCGDTLFAAGCGRLFEGSPAQMVHSLSKLKRLPDHTKVYCGHEYTLANISFAKGVEPNNQALQEYENWAKQQRQQDKTTLPSDIATQKAVNPFLRCHHEEVRSSVQANSEHKLRDEVDVFASLRQWKDKF